MTKRFDVIVAGGGVMGTAAAWQLAARGARVMCVDRFAPPHSFGSSHGATRIIREAYFEHPLYVPLVRRSYRLWNALSRAVAVVPLYTITGGAYVGAPCSTLIQGVLASVNAHNIAHDVLQPAALAERFPALRAGKGMIAVVEERAGFLHVAAAIRAMRGVAMDAGAAFEDHAPVDSFAITSDAVSVRTTRDEYVADRLVVAVGAWVRELLPQVAGVFTVQRQVTTWCAALGAGVAPNEAPVTIWELRSGKTFYTIPDEGDGFKIGVHYGGELTTVAHIDRTVAPSESQNARELLAKYIPPAAGEIRKASVCMYTNAPDLHFVVDWLPDARERVLVLSACSGHGFKFAPAIGEIAAQVVTSGVSDFDLAPFRLSRFSR
ncbi:MAG: N-methyl-L-tryptophan oxidase [Gemmatimonadaceae bacterium]